MNVLEGPRTFSVHIVNTFERTLTRTERIGEFKRAMMVLLTAVQLTQQSGIRLFKNFNPKLMLVSQKLDELSKIKVKCHPD